MTSSIASRAMRNVNVERWSGGNGGDGGDGCPCINRLSATELAAPKSYDAKLEKHPTTFQI